jgi:hypothetical protein
MNQEMMMCFVLPQMEMEIKQKDSHFGRLAMQTADCPA